VRVLAYITVFAILPAAVLAGPVTPFRGTRDDFVARGISRLQLPSTYTFERALSRDGEAASFRWRTEQMAETPKASGISFGPLHAESEMVNGRRRMHYRVDGLSLMGGQIGASLSSRRAILTLRWDAVGD
jgi:hypothetical protein